MFKESLCCMVSKLVLAGMGFAVHILHSRCLLHRAFCASKRIIIVTWTAASAALYGSTLKLLEAAGKISSDQHLILRCCTSSLYMPSLASWQRADQGDLRHFRVYLSLCRVSSRELVCDGTSLGAMNQQLQLPAAIFVKTIQRLRF